MIRASRFYPARVTLTLGVIGMVVWDALGHLHKAGAWFVPDTGYGVYGSPEYEAFWALYWWGVAFLLVALLLLTVADG